MLALGDDLLRIVERLQERVLETQRVLEKRVAEVCCGALGATAKRGAIGRRRRHDQRAVVLERLDESARIARRDDDDPPFDSRIVEHRFELLRRKCIELERRKLDAELVILTAVTGQIHHHDVLVGIDNVADFGKRSAQIADRGERRLEHRVRVVYEHDRAAIGIETVVEQIVCDFDVLAEDVFAREWRETDEIEIGDARPLVLERSERVVEKLWLLDQHVLGRRIRMLRDRHQCLGCSVEPGLIGPDRKRHTE